jgi:predicted ATPase
VATLLSKPKGKILIENPEAHLHPKAQSQLMSFLYDQAQKRDVQVIIETHSDHILNCCLVGLAEKKLSVKDVSIYYFSRKGKNTKATKINCTKNGRIEDAPAGFFDQMDIDLDTLLEY